MAIAPQPMLSVSARHWPEGGRWVLQPKWDGFRLLVAVGGGGELRGWSRHGTDLTAHLGSLLAPLADVAPGTTLDGELVAVAERDGQPVQDFAGVKRAVFGGRLAATDRLRFVAFDLLAVAGQDLRSHPWEERDARLREALPLGGQIRVVASQPATVSAHEAIVALGFEGTVLKRAGSRYRAGRHRGWVKHKARCIARAELRSVHQDRDGCWHAFCKVDGRRVHALAGARSVERIGQIVELVYSRVDADGSLREARVMPVAPHGAGNGRPVIRSPHWACSGRAVMPRSASALVEHAPHNAMEDAGEIARFHDRCSDLMRELLAGLAGAPEKPRPFPEIEESIGWPHRRIASVLGGVWHLRKTEFGGRRPYRFMEPHHADSGRWEMWMDRAQAEAVRTCQSLSSP